MKRLCLLLVSSIIALLAGCAGTIIKDPTTGAVTVDVAAGKAEVATHKDLLGAAVAASAVSTPAVSDYYKAFDMVLTAIENQASACANAVLANKPKLPASPADAGPITKLELAREAVVSLDAGLSNVVKLNCEPLPVITLPKLPKPF